MPERQGWAFGGVNYDNEGTNHYIAWHPKYFGTQSLSKIGCFMLGRYFDMPYSPQLKLTMSREMDGISQIRTKGGVDLINRKYIKPPLWGDLAPWELHDQLIFSGGGYSQKLSRVGRRIWDLSWNYLDGGSLFGTNQAIRGMPPDELNVTGGGPIEDLDLSSGNEWNFNLLTDDNFYSQVINKLNGSQLRFVFQPDVNDNTNFAICKMKNFKFKQINNSVYNVRLKIREVW